MQVHGAPCDPCASRAASSPRDRLGAVRRPVDRPSGLAVMLAHRRLPARSRSAGRRESRRSRCSTSAGRGCWPGSSRRASTPSAQGALAAAVGPGIGVCCYAVGDEVATPLSGAVRGRGRRRRPPRSPRRRRARARREGSRAGRARRPLHRVRARAVLLAPSRPRRDRPPGGDRLRRLNLSATRALSSATSLTRRVDGTTNASARRWGRA